MLSLQLIKINCTSPKIKTVIYKTLHKPIWTYGLQPGPSQFKIKLKIICEILNKNQIKCQ